MWLKCWQAPAPPPPQPATALTLPHVNSHTHIAPASHLPDAAAAPSPETHNNTHTLTPAQLLPASLQPQLHALEPQQQLEQHVVAGEQLRCEQQAQRPLQVQLQVQVVPRVKVGHLNSQLVTQLHLLTG